MAGAAEAEEQRRQKRRAEEPSFFYLSFTSLVSPTSSRHADYGIPSSTYRQNKTPRENTMHRKRNNMKLLISIASSIF